MSKYQQEWKLVLQQDKELKDWKIRTSGGDLLIRVPEKTNMKILEEDFPGIIARFIPLIKSSKSPVKFYVGNTAQSSFIYNLI